MEVQNQAPAYVTPTSDLDRGDLPVASRRDVSARRRNELTRDVVDLSDGEYVDYEEVTDEQIAKEDLDKKLDRIKEQQQQLKDTAQQLEEIDSKYAKGAGKFFRYGASALGILGTFFASKYSSKLLIETLKSAVKNPKLGDLPAAAGKIKEPVNNLIHGAREFINHTMENPAVKSKVDAVKNSTIGKVVKAIIDNPQVKRVLEPIKNTLASVKDIKINGKSVQSIAENTMAGTTTACVVVDDLTGRNNDKSAIDLISAA